MPSVNVKIAGTATTEQKQQVMAGITQLLFDVLDKPHDATYVVFDEVSPDDWSVGGESLTERWAKKG